MQRTAYFSMVRMVLCAPSRRPLICVSYYVFYFVCLFVTSHCPRADDYPDPLYFRCLSAGAGTKASIADHARRAFDDEQQRLVEVTRLINRIISGMN